MRSEQVQIGISEGSNCVGTWQTSQDSDGSTRTLCLPGAVVEAAMDRQGIGHRVSHDHESDVSPGELSDRADYEPVSLQPLVMTHGKQKVSRLNIVLCSKRTPLGWVSQKVVLGGGIGDYNIVRKAMLVPEILVEVRFVVRGGVVDHLVIFPYESW